MSTPLLMLIWIDAALPRDLNTNTHLLIGFVVSRWHRAIFFEFFPGAFFPEGLLSCLNMMVAGVDERRIRGICSIGLVLIRLVYEKLLMSAHFRSFVFWDEISWFINMHQCPLIWEQENFSSVASVLVCWFSGSTIFRTERLLNRVIKMANSPNKLAVGPFNPF